MAIVRLAFANCWRRLSRSVLTLVAMGIAAMVLTTGLSISNGVPRNAYREYSAYLQGDIFVFSPGFIGASPLTARGNEVVRRVVPNSGFNPLLRYYPEFEKNGYYAETSWVHESISHTTLAEIAALPGVTAVKPLYALPASVNGHVVSLQPAPDNYPSRLTEGRALTPGSGQLEVILNAYGNVPKVELGDIVSILVPAFGVDQQGIPYVDSTKAPISIEAVIVGFVSWPTRSVAWQGHADYWYSEQAYVHAPDIYIDIGSWQHIWQMQSAGQAFGLTAASIVIDDMGLLFQYCKTLREMFPHLAVLPISQVVQKALNGNLLDRFYEAPRILWEGSGSDAGIANQDFARLTGILLFVNAGMLLASQMLAAVAARRKEIGILKAIGARQREVIALILIEAVFLAFIGALTGFMLVRLAAVHQALTNGIQWLKVLWETIREMRLVLALTCGLALLFGILPAWQVARLTVMEVFRK